MLVLFYLIVAIVGWAIAAFAMDTEGYTLLESVWGGFFLGLFWFPIVVVYGIRFAVEFLRDF